MQPTSPLVSVLVPAFRPAFLDLCLSSALGQTLADFELLISDDSAGTEIEAVVAKWDDPRITYIRNPTERREGGNRDFLLSIAKGKYIKFLFDDDFIFPHALQRMVETAESRHAQLVFGCWHIVDETGQVIRTVGGSDHWQPPGRLAAETFWEFVLVRTTNFIGGPTNLLLERSALEGLNRPFGIDGTRMRFLTDIALFVNFTHAGYTLAGIEDTTSAWRQHASQYSRPDGPLFSAGIFEWEWMQRWAADHGHITAERCREAIESLHGLYSGFSDAAPELTRFAELGPEPGPDRRFLTDAFRKALQEAHDVVDRRLLRARTSHVDSPLSAIRT